MHCNPGWRIKVDPRRIRTCRALAFEFMAPVYEFSAELIQAPSIMGFMRLRGLTHPYRF